MAWKRSGASISRSTMKRQTRADSAAISAWRSEPGTRGERRDVGEPALAWHCTAPPAHALDSSTPACAGSPAARGGALPGTSPPCPAQPPRLQRPGALRFAQPLRLGAPRQRQPCLHRALGGHKHGAGQHAADETWSRGSQRQRRRARRRAAWCGVSSHLVACTPANPAPALACT